MIRMLVERLALTLLLAMLWMLALERFNPTPPPLLVKADYQRCVTIKTTPVRIHPRSIA